MDPPTLRDAGHAALVLLRAEYDELLYSCCPRDDFGTPQRDHASRLDGEHLAEFETVITALAHALVQGEPAR